MKEIRREVIVPVKEAESIRKLLAVQPQSESQCFGEDETVVYTACFGNGMEMDIKLCGVQFEEGGDNKPWTEAVLFKDGCEICCSEPDDTFFREWRLEYEDMAYIAEAKEEEG